MQADARPRGGGWRIEPALLLGVRLRNVTISTMQGISLRVAPDVSAAYAGGLLVHTEIVPALRLITFAVWEVHYLGGTVGTTYVTPDNAGAVGGGLEALIPTGSRGKLRLSILGRAGIGDGGEALYGRATLGFQFGYRFN